MKRHLKIMALGMAFAIMGSTVAFAEAKEAAQITTGATYVVQESEAAFISQSGKVVSVTATENGSYEVLINNDDGGLRFMIDGNSIIVDRESGNYLTPNQLTEGMEIAVIYPVNSPMGMSMPPFLGKVTAVVANADKGGFIVGSFDEDLLSKRDMLVLNISEDTVIQNLTGTKNNMTADDVKGKDALVFFDTTTRSIPAQTNPSFVLILGEKKSEDEKTKVEETETAGEMIALRDTAEKLGYVVTWQGKNKPVLVENAERTISVSVGSTKYVVDEKEKDANAAAALVNSVLYVSSDILA
ncbi:copper amine oxidase N-terminal domain-containing protein [Anaerotignum sp.]|uniref:copper amine oxidase N-terminal domain-containing protein n=1 Tax=Anaerotignum sp. TaxID=2039241 RepID=UPI002715437B|nr:copper amine oxidase N-terminal domain-containing protein [Anaerotignum sp.]